MSSSPPRHSVSAAAAVVDENGRVLAIRRRDNHRWEPPGGVLELDETIHAGLVREVREETGRWLDRDEIPGHMDEAYAVRLLDALDGGEPAVRAHDGVEVVANDTGRTR